MEEQNIKKDMSVDFTQFRDRFELPSEESESSVLTATPTERWLDD